MVFKRKRIPRRPRRRVIRRRFKRRVPRNLSRQIVHVKKTTAIYSGLNSQSLAVWSSVTGLGGDGTTPFAHINAAILATTPTLAATPSQFLRGGYTFQIADCTPDVTAYQTLYDQFKLNCVVLKFQLAINAQSSTTALATATATFPRMWIATDLDSATIPLLDTIKAYSNVRLLDFSKKNVHTVKLRPRLLMSCYSITGTAFVQNTKSLWVDTRSTGSGIGIAATHYGLVYQVENMMAGQQINTEITYYFSLKNAI